MRQQANRALKQARQEMLEAERRISNLQQLVSAVSSTSSPPLGAGVSWGEVTNAWLLFPRSKIAFGGVHRCKRLGTRREHCSNRVHS